MGYDTNFEGKIEIKPKLDEDLKKYLMNFANSRRMLRDSKKIKYLNNGKGLDYCYKGKTGNFGEYYAYQDDNDNFMGQNDDDSVIDHNIPPKFQPGVWCKFAPNEEGTAIIWTEREKTYGGLKWIKYLIKNFLAPNGYICNGRLDAEGEDEHDLWSIIVINNKVYYVSREYNKQGELCDNVMTMCEII